MNLIAFVFLISSVCGLEADKSNELSNIPDKEEVAAKGYQLLLGADKDTIDQNPYFFKNYGKLGVNYDIEKGQPFIWCEV